MDMASERRTVPNMRSIVLLASDELLSTARMELADAGPFKVKAVDTVKAALAALPTTQPHALVVELGKASAVQLRTLRDVAELAASRKVPIVIFGGELPEDLESRREALQIWGTATGPYRVGPVLEAVRRAIGMADQRKRTDEVRRKLATASQKLRPVQPPPETPETPEEDSPAAPID